MLDFLITLVSNRYESDEDEPVLSLGRAMVLLVVVIAIVAAIIFA